MGCYRLGQPAQSGNNILGVAEAGAFLVPRTSFLRDLPPQVRCAPGDVHHKDPEPRAAELTDQYGERPAGS